MKYSVCASAVFQKLSLPEAIRKIHSLGYSAFEFWSWWDQDLQAIAAAQRETALRAVGFCTRMIPLNDPDMRPSYIQGLLDSIEVAKQLNCPLLISQVGQEIASLSREEQHRSIVEGLSVCAPILERAGITLVIEPLNTLVDHQGYYLSRSDEAFEIVRQVDSPHVKVLFDIYHQQITEGNLVQNLTANIEQIGHIHIAGNPGRHEPFGNSEVHYPTVIHALQAAGYDGAIGLEYFPLLPPEQGLMDIVRQMPL